MGERIAVFELDIPIRWADMDAIGHVNNTLYFRYMEQVRIAWFEAIGFAPERRGEGPVIIHASCTFLRELRYPGTVHCVQYVGEIGRSSVQTYVDLTRTDEPGVLYAQGTAKVVWVDYERSRSAPLPQAARAAIVEPIGTPRR